MKSKTKEEKIVASGLSTVERVPSLASSSRSSRLFPSARIFLGDAPPIDAAKCREQLKSENTALADGQMDPDLIGKPDAYFDGHNEECLLLDSFNSLIHAARCVKKDFILARVMTMDPNDPTRTYWSYYSGHQINKILFRTERDQNWLHRIRCKNPLNNMLIVDAVHYFTIACDEVDRAHRQYEAATGQKVHLVAGGSRNVSASSLLDVTKKTCPLPAAPSKSMTDVSVCATDDEAGPDTNVPGVQPNQRPGGSSSNHTSHDSHKGTHMADPNRNNQPLPFIEYHAKYIGSDEDFLQRQNFRLVFEENAVNPGDAELLQLESFYRRNGQAIVPAAVAAAHREPPQPAAWRNLCGLIYWPPRDSVLIPRTGILNEWSFAVAALVSIGVVVGLGLAVLPIWALLVGGPLCAACLALVAFTLVHFRE